VRRLERQTLEAFGFDGREEGEQGGRLDRGRGRSGQLVELQAERAVIFGGVFRRLFGVDVRGGGRIGARDMEMRQVLAGRHEQGDRQQRAELGLEAGATHGNGGQTIGWLPAPQLKDNRRPLKLSFDTLNSHLSGEPARAYLVSGDEALLAGEAADAIRASVKRAGYAEREVFFIERVADWEGVRASSNNLSLFGSRKLIEMRLPSGKPGVGGANAIVELLRDPNPDNVYLMITGKLEREQQNSAWVKAFDSAGAWLSTRPVELGKLPQWLRGRAKAMALELDDDAVRFIVEQTEGNLLAAQQELEKLRLYGATRVDLAAVQASIADSARFDVFQLGDAALGGDVPRALRILSGLQSEGVEPTLALWSLSREIHNTWGTTQHDGGARGWQRQSPALDSAKRRAGKLPYARLAARLSRADRMIKGQQRGDAWDEMALIIVEFAGRKTLPLPGSRAA
jgi:DNA polymerase III subunit delta